MDIWRILILPITKISFTDENAIWHVISLLKFLPFAHRLKSKLLNATHKALHSLVLGTSIASVLTSPSSTSVLHTY